jgi:hypothetical protein
MTVIYNPFQAGDGYPVTPARISPVVSSPLSGFVLQTPQNKIIDQSTTNDKVDPGEAIIRKSPSLKKKNNSGKTVIKLAQDLVARKCGVIQEEEALEQMTLQKYLDLY